MSSGSSTQQQQQSTSTNTINPQEMAALQGNYATAQQNAASLTPYTGQMVANFNPTQLQAQGALTDIATNPAYQANNTAAIGALQGVLSNPLTSGTGGQLATTNLTPYLNPYTNDVINASIAQNEQARQMAQTNDSQQATAANAFGGSRSGVEAALTNSQYDLNDQANIANLNSQNFTQAQNAANDDLNRTLATAGLTVNAAGQLVTLNNDALNTATQQAGLLSAVGDAQQQQDQQQLSAAYQNYLQGQQLTEQQQQLLNSALGMIPIEQTTNSNGTTDNETESDPGVGGILGDIGSGEKDVSGIGSAVGGLTSLAALF